MDNTEHISAKINGQETIKNEVSTVSIIIPCYNEEGFIERCLDSVLANDYPGKKYEALVVDGMSTDRTRIIVQGYIDRYNNVRLIDNPDRYTPVAFNIGIRNAQNEIIMIMGSHSTYAKDYISQCVYYLNKYEADNVGGTMKTVSRNASLMGELIANTISHPFGVGNSTFRTGSKELKWVDTVFGGCYRREVFNRIGFFNEKLLSSQDIDFNIRLRKSGGKILFVPTIVTDYYTRSDLISFIRNNFRNGVWAILPFKYTKQLLKLRHLVPMFFVSGIITIVTLSIVFPVFWYLTLLFALLYGATAVYHAIGIAVRVKDIRYVFLIPFMFFGLHLVYGLGSIKALFMILKR